LKQYKCDVTRILASSTYHETSKATLENGITTKIFSNCLIL